MATYTFDRYLNIRSAISPVFSPDGDRVAFLSDVTGNFQVWSIGLDKDRQDMWPRQLTFFPDKVWEIHGTKASPHLIAVSDVGGNEKQQLYLISNYGDDATGRESHDVRRLTNADDAIHRFGAWSKDGTQIVYASNVRNNVDFDTYLMDVVTGETRMVAEGKGNRAIVAWSPDGGQLLLIDAIATEEIELYIVDLESRSERQITLNQPMARYQAIRWTERGIFCLSDREEDNFALCQLDVETGELTTIVKADTLLESYDGEQGELYSLVIGSDDTSAIVGLNVEGYIQLYALDLVSESTTKIDGLPSGLIESIKFGDSTERIVCSVQTPSQNPDIWMIDLSSPNHRQLTFSNYAGVDQASFVTPSLIHFPTFDGLDIPAFFYEPKSASPEGGYPCILYVHGGPAGQQPPDFDVRFQYFLNHGYALMVTNVRGSTGYGRKYMLLDEQELRMDSVTDLKHAVMWLHGQTQINRDKIAIYGRSYGGFMVLAALTEYPELFAAGINVVGIANWVSFMERTSPWRRAHREREYGSLDNQQELLERISPIHKAERIQMPLMVIAGDNDPRVPLFESEQIVEKVRNAGGTVEFLHYADEGHRISKLANRIDSFTKMGEFLDRYLR